MVSVFGKCDVRVAMFAGLLGASVSLAACSGDAVSTNNDANGETNNTQNNNIRERPTNATPNTTPGNNTTPGGADMSMETQADMPSSATDMGSPVLPEDPCTPGDELGCDGDNVIICNAEGTKYESQACPGGNACLLGVGCTDMICVPDTRECDGSDTYKVCNSDGSGYDAPLQCEEGTLCSRGACVSQCELGKYRSSYVGCEYWTVDLDNYSDPYTNPMPDEVPHAVVISNPNNKPATVRFQATQMGVSINVPDPIVPAGQARAFTMPRLDVSGTGITQKSIRISSTVPVTAHQFNPLNNEGVASNDASLLLPVNTLGTQYFVVNHPTQIIPCIAGNCLDPQHGYVTVIATEQGTTNLNVTPTAQIAPGDNLGGSSPGSTRSYQLNYGDVLNLEARADSFSGPNDLTGTFIVSDKPIAVFAGHEEAVIGDPDSDEDSCCADHLEQQLFPVKDWGTSYIAALSPGRGIKKDKWKIVSSADGVVVNTNPPQPGANGVTINRGEFLEFFSDQDFEINATGKVLVGQFLIARDQTSGFTGDPALVLGVPVEKFREDYILLTPSGYTSDFVTVIREAGTVIKLNGANIDEAMFAAVGSGTYEVASVPVSPGVQTLEATKPFGISAYGFNNAVSYGYPGGLNLIGAETMMQP